MSIISSFMKVFGLFSYLGTTKTNYAQKGKNGALASNVFAGKDINGFAKIIETKAKTSPNSLFAQANEQDIKILFNSIDKNGNGQIDADEATLISGFDNNHADFSDEDFNLLCDAIQQKIYDANAKQVELDRLAAMNAYRNNIGGNNYANYGVQSRNGSIYSSDNQYSMKKELEEIENEKIPNKKKAIEQAQKDSNAYIDEQNTEIKELLDKQDKAESDLKDSYEIKEKERDDCESKIKEYDETISEHKSAIFTSKSTIANLESEYANLKTDTDNDEVNNRNTARKKEIEQQIAAEKEKISACEEKIAQAEAEKAKQEELKNEKENELVKIQDRIKEIKPETKEKIDEIQEKINAKKEETKTLVEKLNNEINDLEIRAINIQAELGERAGKIASMTGSDVVKNALALAQEDVGKTEATGRNDGIACKYRNGVNNGQPWCASFVSYLYGAGQGSDNGATFGYQASVEGIRQVAIQNGTYAQIGSYNPQPGDIVIMKRNGASHTAIVEAVGANGEIQTIGGNEGNAVRRKVITPGTSQYNKISGFVKMTEWQSKVA